MTDPNKSDFDIEIDATLWMAGEAAQATGGRLAGEDLAWRANGVAIDSREVQPGDLFVALTGEETDGHRYIDAAFEAGAAAALASTGGDDTRGAPLLIVNDTLEGLRNLGRWARARVQDRVKDFTAIGVTGSVGKTSTKEMLAAMLGPQGRTHAPVKSFNNHVGVPLTLARTPTDARFGVYEMGMNHAGEITPLTRMVRPQIALVTAVEAVHLGNFPNGVLGVAAAKGEIFDGIVRGGTAILRRDRHFEFLADKARAGGAADIVDFGPDATALRLLDVRLEGETTRVSARLYGKPLDFVVGAPGAHFGWNALAALGAVAAAGADVDAAAAELAQWRAVSGRGDRVVLRPETGGEILLVDESYNANPASMRAAIAAFAVTPRGRRLDGAPGRRHLFLTDMLELGADADALHAELARAPGLDEIDQIHAAGPQMRAFIDAAPPERRGIWVENAEALAERAPGMLEAGDAAMVKGSLGSRARLVAAALRRIGAA